MEQTVGSTFSQENPKPYKLFTSEETDSEMVDASNPFFKLACESNDSDISSLNVPDMSLCEERLKTFENWPRYMKPGKKELAEAGFQYTGTGDRVICFCCKLVLKNWLPTDTPIQEHAKWNSLCKYVKMTYCKSKHIPHHRGIDVCDGNQNVNFVKQ